MRERLIELLKAALDTPAESGVMVEHIADYLLDNGVIVPPVKVGQTVWSIAEGFNNALEGKIYEYTIRSDGMAYFRFSRNGYFTGTAMEDAIGKTVFFTYAEAEAALKAREQNGK